MSTPPDVGAELASEVERVADRLRSLSQARLEAATPDGRSVAAAAHATAVGLAAAADALGERSRVHDGGGTGPGAGQEPSPMPPLPHLSVFAVGDQVAVTGHDLLAVARARLARVPARAPSAPAPSDTVPARAPSAPDVAAAEAVVQAALEDLRVLRRSL